MLPQLICEGTAVIDTIQPIFSMLFMLLQLEQAQFPTSYSLYFFRQNLQANCTGKGTVWLTQLYF